MNERTIEVDPRSVPDGYEPVAFRIPEDGECYVDFQGELLTCSTRCFSYPRLIVKKKRWRAEKGDVYFFVNHRGRVDTFQEGEDPTDDVMYEIGNYFKTEEEAEVAAAHIKRFLAKGAE